jgi:hypothetical protein
MYCTVDTCSTPALRRWCQNTCSAFLDRFDGRFSAEIDLVLVYLRLQCANIEALVSELDPITWPTLFQRDDVYLVDSVLRSQCFVSCYMPAVRQH